jgi:hypothetical protein
MTSAASLQASTASHFELPKSYTLKRLKRRIWPWNRNARALKAFAPKRFIDEHEVSLSGNGELVRAD